MKRSAVAAALALLALAVVAMAEDGHPRFVETHDLIGYTTDGAAGAVDTTITITGSANAFWAAEGNTASSQRITLAAFVHGTSYPFQLTPSTPTLVSPVFSGRIDSIQVNFRDSPAAPGVHFWLALVKY